jgi:hypothetical protein
MSEYITIDELNAAQEKEREEIERNKKLDEHNCKRTYEILKRSIQQISQDASEDLRMKFQPKRMKLIDDACREKQSRYMKKLNAEYLNLNKEIRKAKIYEKLLNRRMEKNLMERCREKWGHDFKDDICRRCQFVSYWINWIDEIIRRVEKEYNEA